MKYTIKIPKPCNENWAEMTPTERGRYCKVCQKEVYDFTKMSNFELVKRIDRGESVCGRFKKSQLEVELDSLKDVSTWGRVALFLGLTSLVSMVAQPIQAQTQSNIATPIQQSETTRKPQSNDDTLKDNEFVIIKGRVLEDYNGEGLFDVDISYINELDTISTRTNFKGEFCLEIPKKEFTPNIELSFSSFGFHTYTCFTDKNTSYFEIIMEDKKSYFVSGAVIIKKRPSLLKRFLNLFRRKDKK